MRATPRMEEITAALADLARAVLGQVLGGLDLSGDSRQALRTLIGSSWRLIADAGAVLEAAPSVLPPGRIRDLHATQARRVEALIGRGQAEGAFRTDLPASRLVSVLHHVLKGAAADVSAGRLDPADAPRFIVATVLAAYEPEPAHLRA